MCENSQLINHFMFIYLKMPANTHVEAHGSYKL